MLNNVYELEVMSRQLPDERAAEVAHNRLVSKLKRESRLQMAERESFRPEPRPQRSLAAWLLSALRG